MSTPLPYFDLILGQLGRGDADFATAFCRHVHWGYWPDPTAADGSVADFAAALERMSRFVVATADIRAGHDVLDVGCGLGGTLATLNDICSGLQMTGLNIDERQLERARLEVLPRADNRIDFVHGDACQLPFPDACFDRVLAVECIFHFPSRREFFREARRVLRPGGRLIVSDFVAWPSGEAIGWMVLAGITFMPLVLVPYLLPHLAADTWGSTTLLSLARYGELAATTGFTMTRPEDISAGALPTGRAVASLFARVSLDAAIGMLVAEAAVRLGSQRYTVLRFDCL